MSLYVYEGTESDEHDLSRAAEAFFALADYLGKEYPHATREINVLREAAEYAQSRCY